MLSMNKNKNHINGNQIHKLYRM